MNNLDPDVVFEQANAGDPAAQYMMAAISARQGKVTQADEWLKKAAENNHPDALFTLGTRDLATNRRLPEAIACFQVAAAQGSQAAEHMLVSLGVSEFVEAQEWAAAVDRMILLAKAEYPAALRDLAAICMLRPEGTAIAIPLVNRALKQDPIAAAMSARMVIAGLVGIDAVGMRESLRHLADARYPNISMLLPAGEKRTSNVHVQSVDWDGVRSIALACENPLIEESRLLSITPEVQVYESAFSAPICEYLIAKAAPLSMPSTIVDPRDGSSMQDAYRTSLTATIGPVDFDLTLVAFNKKLSALAGCENRKGEFLSVLRYRTGDEYRPHFDWLDEGGDLGTLGQRTHTALTYLNDGYVGGETHFLANDLKIAGKPGDVVIFKNTNPDGSPDRQAQHAGLPVLSGEKWLASKWYRSKDFRF